VYGVCGSIWSGSAAGDVRAYSSSHCCTHSITNSLTILGPNNYCNFESFGSSYFQPNSASYRDTRDSAISDSDPDSIFITLCITKQNANNTTAFSFADS
jgi:hypothetical protein